jgi:pimeloyl-ACP methyl ester carboxylesterase
MDRNQPGSYEECAVKSVVEGRELFTLEVFGVAVQGTCHLPQRQSSFGDASAQKQSRPGILFLSGLLAPRAGIGDSMVYWADSLADCGYKCFRVDLPGTCDSDGEPPAELLNFINSGSYEAITVEIMNQIVLRFDLTSVHLVGHCSGTVTALFAASSSVHCRGLILLEPYFHLPPPVATKTREALSDWAASNRLGGILSNLLDLLKAIRLRLRRTELPGNANLPLLKRWKRLASAGLPILMLKVPGAKAVGAKPRRGGFDYLAYVLRFGGNRGRVDVKVIEGAGHSFADPAGRSAVRRYIESWMNEYFPQGAVDPTLLRDQTLPAQTEHSVSNGSLVPVSPGN